MADLRPEEHHHFYPIEARLRIFVYGGVGRVGTAGADEFSRRVKMAIKYTYSRFH